MRNINRILRWLGYALDEYKKAQLTPEEEGALAKIPHSPVDELPPREQAAQLANRFGEISNKAAHVKKLLLEI